MVQLKHELIEWRQCMPTQINLKNNVNSVTLYITCLNHKHEDNLISVKFYERDAKG